MLYIGISKVREDDHPKKSAHGTAKREETIEEMGDREKEEKRAESTVSATFPAFL